ncbi:MAG: FAD-binding oxidoreductase [Pseudomonadota bacterium]
MLRWTGEAERGTPYWWPQETAPKNCDAALPDICDLLVVGAGYTGLSAAIAARNCGAHVCVVDAGTPGFGASSRNGGMFGAHPRLSWAKLERLFGADVADGVFAEASIALDWVKALISDQSIDCDLQITGRIQLAWTKAHSENQAQLARGVRAKSRVKVEQISRQDLAGEIVSDQYFGGLLFPEHGGLHPEKFHRGLLAAAQRSGAQIVADAGVTGLSRRAGATVATTAKGDIKAQKVVLATNGYTPEIFRWNKARVFPLPSYMIATEALPKDLIDQIAPTRRMMVETRARHSYFRVSPDGTRLLWGGRAAMIPIDIETAAARLRRTMLEVWPQLGNCKLSHVWTGNTGYSFTHMPHVGVHNGLHYAMGFSGSGTVMAPYLGAKAAYQALGDPRGKTAYSHTALRSSVLHPASRPYFLHAADFWYRNWVDRWETRSGRA